MSIKNVETKFAMKRSGGRVDKFTGICELGITESGGFAVNGWTSPPTRPGGPRGSFFTSLPISPADYRKRNPTGAGFERKARSLTLIDDWGCRYTITAPKSILDTLTAILVAASIPNRGK